MTIPSSLEIASDKEDQKDKTKEAFLYVACHYNDQGVPAAPIKIGVTTNLERRIQDLRIGNPSRIGFFLKICFKDEVSAYKAERDLHFCFEEDGVSGEWFEVDPQKILGTYIDRSIVWREHVITNYVIQREYHWSYIIATSEQNAIIGKFIELHKNGQDLYKEFKREVETDPNIDRKMPSWWMTGEDKDSYPNEQDALVSLLKMHGTCTRNGK